MSKHEQQIARGQEAERLLNSPMFQAAFEDTRRAMLEAWAAMPESQTGRLMRWFQGRSSADDLHRMVKCLDRVKRCIEVHIDTGRIAQKEIEGRAKRPFS
jgi:hypothetical protein